MVRLKTGFGLPAVASFVLARLAAQRGGSSNPRAGLENEGEDYAAYDDAEANDQCKCEDGWTAFNGFCFYFNPKMRGSMNDALSYCRSMDGDSSLVTFHNEQDMRRVIKRFKVKATRVWLGLTQVEGLGFQWIDSSPFDYTNWNKPESELPEGQPCGVFSRNGRWYSSECDRRRQFICERSCVKRKITERFQIHSPSELLGLAGFDGQLMLGHGCWCPNLATELERTKTEPPLKGMPMDFVDQQCRGWSSCHRCATDFCKENKHDSNSTQYSSAALGADVYTVVVDYTVGNVECDSVGNTPCQNRKCECDVRLIQDLMTNDVLMDDPNSSIGIKPDVEVGDCKQSVKQKAAKDELNKKVQSMVERLVKEQPGASDNVEDRMSMLRSSAMSQVKQASKCCYLGEGLWETFKPLTQQCTDGAVSDLF